MDKDKDRMANLYGNIIEEQMAPLAVKSNAKGDGKTGGLEPGELPADTASTTEIQKGTGAENAKGIKTPEEGEEKINPVKKDKGTTKTATKKTVTESDGPKASFMDLYNQVIKEEGEDIESASYDDDVGDFPEPEGEVSPEGEGEGEMGEGEIYTQLADLFGRLASIKGGDLGGEDEMGAPEDEMGAPEDGMGENVPEESVSTLMDKRLRLAENVMRNPSRYHRFQVEHARRIIRDTLEEAVSEPEPAELHSDISLLQLPRKLAGKGVTKGSSKAVAKGTDKDRTGELETGPEGFKHDKSKFAVAGKGPIHSAKNASFLES